MQCFHGAWLELIQFHHDLYWTMSKNHYSVGQILTCMTQNMKPYLEYTQNYRRIHHFVAQSIENRSDLGNYIIETETKELNRGKNDFFSYIITPIQRLPRYLLYIKEF